jgi:hypothetical protein
MSISKTDALPLGYAPDNIIIGRIMGFEPITTGTTIRYSTIELYLPLNKKNYSGRVGFEPTVLKSTPVFKTGTFDHSVIYL